MIKWIKFILIMSTLFSYVWTLMRSNERKRFYIVDEVYDLVTACSLLGSFFFILYTE